MAKCEQGYLCDVCGKDVEAITDSGLYLRYVMGELPAERLPLSRHLLFVSGRASFEIMQKALAGRIPIIVAVSAPSSLAVEFAEESGQTLVAFLRGERLNVYSHPERIQFS